MRSTTLKGAAMERDIRVSETPADLVQAAAKLFAETVQEAVKERGICHIALSGGSTPESLYRALADSPWKESIPWKSVRLFWGDERCVPPDHEDSNYRMATQAMIQHVPIPDSNVHRIAGEHDPADAAREYSACIGELLGHNPVFDLILLGLGPDGHTASLFPGTGAVPVRDRIATEVFVPHLDAWRITLTRPVLNRARTVVFLVQGTSKADMVRRVVEEEPSEAYPASLVRPESGRLIWMVDREVTSRMNRED